MKLYSILLLNILLSDWPHSSVVRQIHMQLLTNSDSELPRNPHATCHKSMVDIGYLLFHEIDREEKAEEKEAQAQSIYAGYSMG